MTKTPSHVDAISYEQVIKLEKSITQAQKEVKATRLAYNQERDVARATTLLKTWEKKLDKMKELKQQQIKAVKKMIGEQEAPQYIEEVTYYYNPLYSFA